VSPVKSRRCANAARVEVGRETVQKRDAPTLQSGNARSDERTESAAHVPQNSQKCDRDGSPDCARPDEHKCDRDTRSARRPVSGYIVRPVEPVQTAVTASRRAPAAVEVVRRRRRSADKIWEEEEEERKPAFEEEASETLSAARRLVRILAVARTLDDEQVGKFISPLLLNALQNAVNPVNPHRAEPAAEIAEPPPGVRGLPDLVRAAQGPPSVHSARSQGSAAPSPRSVAPSRLSSRAPSVASASSSPKPSPSVPASRTSTPRGAGKSTRGVLGAGRPRRPQRVDESQPIEAEPPKPYRRIGIQ